MSKFRIISKSGDGAGLAFILASEGHSVDWWLEDPKGSDLYKGLIPRVSDWKKGLKRDTVLLFDMSSFGKEADAARAAGIPVVGGSALADKLELDRGYGLDVAGEAGVAVPPSENFTDFRKAIAFLEGQKLDSGWVFKPDDNREGVRTFVSQNIEEMTRVLELAAEKWKGSVSLILQQVVKGVEVSSEAWFVEGQYIPGSYNNTLEQKRFLNEDLGPNTGCMGSTVKFGLSKGLWDKTFRKLLPWIERSRLSGPLDMNCIISRSGIAQMLEWTPRFGYSAIYAFVRGLGMPLGVFLEAIARKEKGLVVTPSTDWLGALRLSMPPYPHCEDAPQCKGLPIIGLDLGSEGVVPLDVMVKDKRLVCSGFDGIIAELTTHAQYVEQVWGQLYGVARHVIIPELQYRTDCAKNVLQRLDDLQNLGLVEPREVI